jgi:hypothetical protein
VSCHFTGWSIIAEGGDINRNGVISAVDAPVILRYAVGLPLELLIGCPPAL